MAGRAPRFSGLRKRMADEKLKLSGSVIRVNYSQNGGMSFFLLDATDGQTPIERSRVVACLCLCQKCERLLQAHTHDLNH